MSGFFRKVYNLFVYVIITPVFLFLMQLVFRQRKGLIVVTLPKARIYADNTRYFFEHSFFNTSLNTVLLIKDKQVYKQLSKRFVGRVLYSYSKEGLMSVVRSSVILFTGNKYDIYPYYPVFLNKLVINLWHGTPLKRVNYLHRKRMKLNRNNMFFCNKLSTSSEFTKYLMTTQFRLHPDDVWITGQPRNDVFCKRELQLSIDEKHWYLNKKTILYAPTYRLNNPIEPFFLKGKGLDEMYELLIVTDVYLLVRLHTNELRLFPDSAKLFGTYSDRIIIANEDIFPSIQQLMLHTDILMTDYSSLFFDFLLTNRPIIFLPYDIDTYDESCGFNVDYFDNTPGPKPLDMVELKKCLFEYIENPNKDFEKRERINDKYNKYNDGCASERIAKAISDCLLVK